MEFAVHSALWVLVILASYLLITIARLANQDKLLNPETNTLESGKEDFPAPARIEGITQLQKFAASQMLELRLKGMDPVKLQRKDWLFSGTCHYFWGACRTIAGHVQCPEQLNDMFEFVLRRNLGLDALDTPRVLRQLQSGAIQDFQEQAASLGQRAAQHWLAHQRVPNNTSLYASINEWSMAV